MRLNNYNSPKTDSAGDPYGPSADIVEHILQTSEKKRSRPTSSLDIKIEGGSKMTTPPSKNGEKRQTRTAAKEQQQQQQLQRRSAHQMRSRRGRLPSHKKYDGMDDEDLLQALYEDPELMAAAAASQQTNKESSKKYSKKSKSVNEYPDHLKSMMEDGVPVTQWIIVLVLLGAGIYQLRKSLVGPSTGAASATKAGTRKVNERGMARKNSKQKGKKTPVKTKGRARNSIPRSSLPEAEENQTAAVSPIEEELVSEQPVVEKATKKKEASKKKSRRQRTVKSSRSADNAVGDEGGSHESPDSVSTDGSSSTEIVPQAEEDRGMMANLTEESQLSPEEMRVDSEGWQTMATDEEGWQTVRSGDRQRKKAETKVDEKKEAENATVAVGDIPGPKESEHVRSETAPGIDPIVPEVHKGENTVEQVDSAGAKSGSLDKIEAAQETGEPVEVVAKEADPSEKKDEVVPSTAQPDSSGSSSGGKKSAKSSKKKKGKKKKSSKPIEKEPAATQNGNKGTDDDEALALRLQQEENKFAMTASHAEPAPVEEVWEEVSKPKKKKKAPLVAEE